MNKNDLLKEITSLCLEFDKAHGTWPEHHLEGKALLEFFCDKHGIEFDGDAYDKDTDLFEE